MTSKPTPPKKKYRTKSQTIYSQTYEIDGELSRSGPALIDTGASTSAIDISVAERLGLIPLRKMQGGTAKDTQPFDVFAIKFRFPGTGLCKGLNRIDFKRVLDADLSGQILGISTGTSSH